MNDPRSESPRGVTVTRIGVPRHEMTQEEWADIRRQIRQAPGDVVLFNSPRTIDHSFGDLIWVGQGV